MHEASRPAIYPRYCFHLSPTVNTWCLLRASEIHLLEQHAGFQGENFFFYQNLPIKWVRIVGVVVAVEDFAGPGKNSTSRRVYTVDDSSGACIEALLLVPAETDKPGGMADKKGLQVSPPYQDLDVGAVVDIKGGLSTFRGEKQINIEKTVCLRGTAQEVALWEKRDKFRRDVLDKPWVLRDRDVRRCRKEAEKSEAGAERKRKRLEAMTTVRSAGKQAAETKAKNNVAGNLRGMIRGGAMTGKYDALGL
ncbi:telomere regulation protein stn1 domain-containing protein [Hirsutella rhossiliensis]|uniref:Telomere regulation protein stn1 domain-containing protein n=1 Tax=Hirsutella rhossiliensis TaxID=111463 RepID=A0A9P8MP89_9HYPO|nr:telomere regulation protein stn1 domain-containing protein [Hirsutella rhossiliensis]KAH0958765.1 telomere regulation protein stn1 domain-containing protein [Hirsutella rhossiliensis]